VEFGWMPNKQGCWQVEPFGKENNIVKVSDFEGLNELLNAKNKTMPKIRVVITKIREFFTDMIVFGEAA
jgi:hypothetical protein